MSRPGEVLLSVRNLCVDYGAGANATRALAGVDLELARGECLAVAGESGSGKSTLALALLGLLPSSATLRLDALHAFGRDLSSADSKHWSALRGVHLGFVPQDGLAAFDPLLPIGAQIAQLLVQRGATRAAAGARSLELLGEVGLEQAADLAREIPARLSGGQRQRASIAAAIALDPQLLIADEPTSALDPVHARALIDLLDGLRRSRGLALLWITHELRAIAARAERIMVLYAGRCVEAGRASLVLGAPRHPYTRLLVRSLPDAARPGAPLAAMALPAAQALPRVAACAFHPRCPLADERCRSQNPALARDPRGHAAACHHLERAAEL